MTAKILSTPYLAAITGSIGSGKSTAAKFLKELGAEVIDADELAREAVEPGTEALTKIKEVFGKEYLLKSGELNRKKMASLIFSNREAKEKLEAIVHPEVRRLFRRKLEAQKNKPIIFYVIPLLFEVKSPPEEIKKIVVIAADKKLALERIVKRDKITLEEAEKRYDNQLPIEEKVKKANYVIWNNGEINQLKEEIVKLYEKIKKEVNSA